MASVRPAAVAGLFYPGAKRALAEMVEGFLGERGAPAAPAVSATPADHRPKALIAPHAGYVYSGPVAASAFSTLSRSAAAIRRVVLLGPSHFVAFRGLALPGHERLATPLGDVAVDPEGAAQVLRLPQVRLYPEAHQREHSLEVELPFLQIALQEAWSVVPLVVGESPAEEVGEVIDALWDGAETLVVVSSDLSHYLDYDAAQRTDRATAEAVVRLEGPLESRQACGARPINGLLQVARRRGMRCELLDLRNSGDTAGDPSRVVGYGAFAFYDVEA